MSLLQTIINLKPFLNPLSATLNPTTTRRRNPSLYLKTLNPKPLILLLCSSSSSSSDNSTRTPNPKPKRKQQSLSSNSDTQEEGLEQKPTEETFPTTIPRKPRRGGGGGGGRKTEAAAVEDFVRDSLEKTFASIRQQNADVLEDKEKILREKIDVDDDEDDDDDDDNDGDGDGGGTEKKEVVEEEDPNWPLDADVGWGISASEYFDKHSIRNVIGEDGVEIDWEGEVDDNFVKEINCLEWESFAFHPSPLIVLVFERYNRATDNWKLLKELEKATKVYWCAKDRLPPRTVKIDINIERDLAYALKVKECPQLLFLRGNTILYREKEFRTSEELVLMIAHFYYNAKKPSWIDNAALAPPY